MKKAKVLFVDDDGSIRNLATALFHNKAFEPIVVPNTAEAEQALLTNLVDVIVCDVMMPQESGFDFCERLKKSGNLTPFLFLTVLGDPESVSKGLKKGADAYLRKPFDIKDLEKHILALLASKRNSKPAPRKTPA